MTLLLGSAIKVVGGEEVVRITQGDLAELERDAQRKFAHARPGLAAEAGEFEINVVGVRTRSEGGGRGLGGVGRRKEHEEFLVRTRRAGRDDVFVWRRYGDFKRLAEEVRPLPPPLLPPARPSDPRASLTPRVPLLLCATPPPPLLQLRLRHPDEDIRSLPAKDKSTSAMPSPPPSTPPSSSGGAAADAYAGMSGAAAAAVGAGQSTRAYLASWMPGSASPLRASFDGGAEGGGEPTTTTAAAASAGESTTTAPAPTPAAPLTREKNRLTLRSFLRSFLLHSTLASSPVLRSFLLSGPQTLSPPEIADAKRREDADVVREEGRRRFKLEAGKRVEELRESVKELREEVIQSKGVRRVFEVLATVDKVGGLPDEYRKVLEYGKISSVLPSFVLLLASSRPCARQLTPSLLSPPPPPSVSPSVTRDFLPHATASRPPSSRRLSRRTTRARRSTSSGACTASCRTLSSRASCGSATRWP